jgi:hypothetical protein
MLAICLSTALSNAKVIGNSLLAFHSAIFRSTLDAKTALFLVFALILSLVAVSTSRRPRGGYLATTRP